MIRFFTLLLIIAASPLFAQPSEEVRDYCAFEIVVHSPDGGPVVGTEVMEFGPGGDAIASALTDQQGVARLCDARVGLVDIEVGGRRCGAVGVRYLRPWWLKTRRVSVTYRSCAGEEWAVAGGCLLTIRVKDQYNLPVVGVLFESPNERPRPQTRISDKFGRIFRFIEYGETTIGWLLKDGYSRQIVNQSCRSKEDTNERELTVILAGCGKTQPNHVTDEMF